MDLFLVVFFQNLLESQEKKIVLDDKGPPRGIFWPILLFLIFRGPFRSLTFCDYSYELDYFFFFCSFYVTYFCTLQVISKMAMNNFIWIVNISYNYFLKYLQYNIFIL